MALLDVDAIPRERAFFLKRTFSQRLVFLSEVAFWFLAASPMDRERDLYCPVHTLSVNGESSPGKGEKNASLSISACCAVFASYLHDHGRYALFCCEGQESDSVLRIDSLSSAFRPLAVHVWRGQLPLESQSSVPVTGEGDQRSNCQDLESNHAAATAVPTVLSLPIHAPCMAVDLRE